MSIYPILFSLLIALFSLSPPPLVEGAGGVVKGTVSSQNGIRLEEVRVEIDGQLKGKFSEKWKEKEFPDFTLLEQTEIDGITLSAEQLLPKNCLIFTHNSPVCVDIPTRYGIIHR